jgi:hypothetical protein
MSKPNVAVVLTLCLLASIPVFGQTSNATLGGTVSDPTGAFIPGVSITATNTATGIVTPVLSNEAGAYQFASLQTGTYTVTAELPGFQTQTYNNVILGVSQQVRLNFTLQVGGIAQNVEVTVAADTLIATTSSSVGSVLPDYKVRDLPLGGRNVLDLVYTTAGAGPQGNTTAGSGFFAGGRVSQVNVTRDGFVVSDGRYSFGAFSTTYSSPDLVEEVRIITAPVDAEPGRGSGQVQMSTRSGTNQFRGSLFWTNRNSALDASNWFNNFNGVQKDYENRNQFGGRLGGPIVKNKTFFFVLVDEQRYALRQTFVGTVLTNEARQGIYRFFPGVESQNAIQNNPTVDRNGNPVRPPNSTGDLRSFSVFTDSSGGTRDPLRPGYDPSGFIQNVLLARMPRPNDYTVGDGLNTAGIRFTRRLSGLDLNIGNGLDVNRDQVNLRIDHNFNTNHKLSAVYTYEHDWAQTLASGIMNWPDGYNGAADRWPRFYTGSLVSTLSSNVVNELRVGYKRSSLSGSAPFYVGRKGEGEPNAQGKEVLALLPTRDGIPFQPVSTLFPNNFINWTAGDNGTRGAVSPFYTFADTVSWIKGKHAFKAGGEFRFANSDSWNDTNFTPQAILGAGGVPVANIDQIAIPNLSANDQARARNLLTDLSGSVASISQGFDIRDPNNLVFRGYSDGVKLKLRDYHGNEFSGFFKDTWKLRPSLTLNMGIHYEWFGVPYEGHGLAGKGVGGEASLCGISCGALTTVEFVGKHSPNPDKQLFDNEWNNFAPSFGLSWSLPWLGKDKTVLRAGYGWSYTGGLKTIGDITAIAQLAGTFAGTGATGLSYTTNNFLSLANLRLPIPQQYAPLRPVPIDGTRTDSMAGAVSNRRSPYIQNFNVEIQRELPQQFTLSAAYVGTKGTRLWGGIPLNTVEIFRNNFLDAFNVTRAGGAAPLFDQMLAGLNIPGAGVVNGTTVTGSAALRAFTSTRALIANGNVGGLADFLNRSTSVTGRGGGFVRNSGLFPENFFVLNPQFNNVTLYTNPGSSTYHSLQVQVTKRLSHGVTNSTAYTWSRALGENDTDGAVTYLDPRNRSLNKTLLGFHRTHMFTSNATLELPLGPNRRFLSNAPGFVQRMVERWQLGGIFSWSSGAPLSLSAPISTITQSTAVTTPNIVGDFPKSAGEVTRVANGVTYFPDTQQINDPSGAAVSSLNGLSGSFNNKAIADSQGSLLLVNPAPGTLGTLGLKWIEGPAALGLDVNLIKRVRLTETKEFEFRVDAVNVLNHPNFDEPVLNINNTSFGRITSATGNRRFVMSLRVNF